MSGFVVGPLDAPRRGPSVCPNPAKAAEILLKNSELGIESIGWPLATEFGLGGQFGPINTYQATHSDWRESRAYIRLVWCSRRLAFQNAVGGESLIVSLSDSTLTRLALPPALAGQRFCRKVARRPVIGC
jgi:hypothetical protein